MAKRKIWAVVERNIKRALKQVRKFGQKNQGHFYFFFFLGPGSAACGLHLAQYHLPFGF